jgi:hypothetical protein
MSVNNIYYNPVSLETAANTWHNDTSYIPIRFLKTVKSALYDIYVKNPYDLTCGNLFSSQETTTQTVAAKFIGVVAVFYSLMLYGITLNLTGSPIAALGDKICFPFLSKTGFAVQKLGEKLFLAGAVPSYGLFYALPKKLIQSIPAAVKFVSNQIKVLIDKVGQIATYIFDKVLVPLWRDVIIPALEGIKNAFSWVATKLVKAIEYLFEKIVQVGNFIFEKLLVPLWKDVIIPVLEGIKNAFSWVVTNLGKAIQYLSDKIVQVGNFIFEKVLVSLWKDVIIPALEGIKNVFSWVVTNLGKAIQYLSDKIVQVGNFIFEKAFHCGKM